MVQVVEEDAAFAEEPQVIRLVAVNDFIHADFLSFPVSQGIHKRVSALLSPQFGCLDAHRMPEVPKVGVLSTASFFQ